MGRMLRCGEVMAGCDTVLYGKTDEEVFGKAEDHARHDHNMTMIPPNVVREYVDHIIEGEPPKRWFGLRG